MSSHKTSTDQSSIAHDATLQTSSTEDPKRQPPSTHPITPASSTSATTTPNHLPRPSTTNLQSTISSLEAQIASTRAQLSTNLARLRDLLPDTPSAPQRPPSSVSIPSDLDEQDRATLQAARGVVARHIELLRRYNEIKDIGMGLIEIVAEREGKRIAEVMEDFGVDEND